MKLREKRAQFYIAATIVIVALIVGLVTVTNYYSRLNIQDLDLVGSDLSLEVQKVFESAIEQGLSDENLSKELESFVTNYVESSDIETDFYFVFGEKNDIKVAGYVESSDEKIVPYTTNQYVVDLSPETNSKIDLNKGYYSVSDIIYTSQIIKLGVDENVYEIPISDGRNFKYIISRDIKGEKHIIVKK